MADLQDYLENLKVEKFSNFKFNKSLLRFDVNENMVIYFDLEDNKEVNHYIKSNLESLQKKFLSEGKNFIYLSRLFYPNNIRDILSFYLPHLSSENLQHFNFTETNLESGAKLFEEVFTENSSNKVDQSVYQSLLDFIGYSGRITSGFVFFDHRDYYDYDANCDTSILECNDFLIKDNPDTYFENLVEFFKKESYRCAYDYMIDNLPKPAFYDEVDEETRARIEEIQKQLSELKASGQLLFVLPILRNILEDEFKAINPDNISNIRLEDNYRIVLPYFNNLEIKLSHLTKAVYVLFYNHPHGINIKELHKYKDQLLHLYSGISNQLDYDKMKQSIDDLVHPESKAIYTHISRIKSVFYKQMAEVYARNYVIESGSHGDEIKYIPVIKRING